MTTPLGTAATRALEAHDLYRFYHAGEDETLALRGVSFHVDLGEIVALVIATHSDALAARADRLVRLLDGRVVD